MKNDLKQDMNNSIKIFIYKHAAIRLPYKFFALCINGEYKRIGEMIRGRLKYQIRLIKARISPQNRLPGRISTEFKVSIIVPNYNHEPYLRERLESIYCQSYKNYEVILLDDSSSDNSVNILKEYADRYSENTKVYVNEKNSGGVFCQWKKGIELASGQLCWIAESDDFADCDFLEKLIPFFEDEAVMLAYAHMVFWKDGHKANYTYERYLNDIPSYVWDKTYKRSANLEVEEALAYKNVIPNVSGVLFRKPGFLPLLSDKTFLDMKVCGDWVFYLNLIAGGRIAYSSCTNNYCRFHEDSASKKTHTKECYYQEHETVAKTIVGLYKYCDAGLDINYKLVRDYYFDTVEGATDAAFTKLYDQKRINGQKEKRKISILISIESFSIGGGEIFPIKLANALKRKGYPVSIHCLNKELSEPAVRGMLDAVIPVFYANNSKELMALFEEYHFDIINTHHPATQQMIGEIYYNDPKALNGSKHVATLHGMYETMTNQYINDYLAIINESVDLWVRVADKNLAPFKRIGIYDENKNDMIPNGVLTPSSFKVNREELGINKDAFVVCVASRAIKQKGWAESIECVSQVRKNTGRDVQLLLLGEGIIYDQLREKTVPDYVHLLGFVKDPCEYYHISDAGLLLTSYIGESMPITLMEAISVGTPVIATNVGEVRWIISEENGKSAGELIDIDAGMALISASVSILTRWVENNSEYLIYKKAAEESAGRFNMENSVDQYINVFKKVLVAS